MKYAYKINMLCFDEESSDMIMNRDMPLLPKSNVVLPKKKEYYVGTHKCIELSFTLRNDATIKDLVEQRLPCSLQVSLFYSLCHMAKAVNAYVIVRGNIEMHIAFGYVTVAKTKEEVKQYLGILGQCKYRVKTAEKILLEDKCFPYHAFFALQKKMEHTGIGDMEVFTDTLFTLPSK